MAAIAARIKFGYSGTTRNGLPPSTDPEVGGRQLPRLGVAGMSRGPLPRSFGKQASIKVPLAKTT